MLSIQHRGKDATGIAAVSKEGVAITKDILLAEAFIRSKSYKNSMLTNPHIVLGHTRQATTGINIQTNAHPFEKGNIVGCHNGIVSNYRDLNPKVSVDSEVIFELLSDYSFDHKNQAFEKLEGWFAISWIDKRKPGSVFLTRYKNEALYVVNVPELHTIFWCSVELPLQYAIVASLGYQKRSIWKPEEQEIYSISSTLGITKQKAKFGTNIFKKFLGKKHKHDKKEDNVIYLSDGKKLHFNTGGITEKFPRERRDNHKVFNLLQTDRDTIKELLTVTEVVCPYCGKDLHGFLGTWFDRKNKIFLCIKCGNDLRSYSDYTYIASQDLYILKQIVSYSNH